MSERHDIFVIFIYFLLGNLDARNAVAYFETREDNIVIKVPREKILIY